MLDRFKFRIWDEESGEMFYGDLGVYCSTEGGLQLCHDRAILMQSIGINQDDEVADNEELIFENDIVEIYFYDKKVMCKVVINFGMITFVSKHFDGGFKHLSDLVSIDNGYAWIAGCRVIGDIYKNPELLEYL